LRWVCWPDSSRLAARRALILLWTFDVD